MRIPASRLSISVLFMAVFACCGDGIRAQEFELLFDGKSLQGWHGDSRYWKVKDGAITGHSSKDNPLVRGTYLYSDKQFGDFELHFRYRINSSWGNSGVQYRSRVIDEDSYSVHGYQADIESGDTYNGILYDVGGRQFMAKRGEKVVINKDGKKVVVGQTCDPVKAQASIKHGEWNDYTVIAFKNRLRHVINGHVAVEVEDNEPGKGALTGILAFQMHQGPPMEIQFKDVRIKKLNSLPSLAQASSSSSSDQSAMHVSAGLRLLPGYEAEHLYSVPKKTQGSWISMTFDDKGRMIATAEGGSLYRVSYPQIGVRGEAKVEEIKIKEAKDTRGLLYAFDSLYVVSDAVYRLQDSNGDGQFDKVTKIFDKATSRSAHGSHAMIVTEDGKGIYFINGNFNKFNKCMPSRQPPVWKEDSLLPYIINNRHAADVMAPGAWLCRFDPDGGNPVMLASGMRNPCDIAFNKDGELFTFDADMEWDMGMPWYRPTRINHLTSGAEFGWRTGSQKWPEYYPDSLGSVVDIGPSSPTGIVFGTKTRFPSRYRDCLFICDWTFGTLYAVHLGERGASYVGEKEEFVTKMGFPLVDVEVGPEGALYLLTGGWANQSDVYRVRYTGSQGDASQAIALDATAAVRAQQLRTLRRKLERHHQSVGVKAVEEAWSYLSHPDRHVRYAARIAIENQDLRHWRERVFAESDPIRLMHAVIALARHGDASMLEGTIQKLGEIDLAELSRFHQLGLLRVYGLVFSRWGKPSAELNHQVVKRIDPYYPSRDKDLNRELCCLLSYLEAPQVVQKTIRLMRSEKEEAVTADNALLKRNEGNPRAKTNGAVIERMLENHPNVQNVYYLYALKNVSKGWSFEDRKYYFAWLKENMKRNGGVCYPYFMNKIKDEAIQNVPDDQKKALAYLLSDEKPVDLGSLPKAKGPGKNWQKGEVLALLETGLVKRDFAQGKKMFQAAHCAVCHKFAGEGGLVGPDLSSLANRFSPGDIFESISEPSKAINQFYQSSMITLKGGGMVLGQVIEETASELKVMANAYNPSQLTVVDVSKIESREHSAVSQMPPALISMFNQDELLDFMAYILSSGNREHAYYKKK